MEDWRTEASSSGRKKGPSGRIWWRLAAAVVEGWEPVVLGKGRDWSWWRLEEGILRRQQGKRTAEAAVQQPMLQRALGAL